MYLIIRFKKKNNRIMSINAKSTCQTSAFINNEDSQETAKEGNFLTISSTYTENVSLRKKSQSLQFTVSNPLINSVTVSIHLIAKIRKQLTSKAQLPIRCNKHHNGNFWKHKKDAGRSRTLVGRHFYSVLNQESWSRQWNTMQLLKKTTHNKQKRK